MHARLPGAALTLFIAAFALLAAPAPAQTTGNVVGAVRDADGAPLPGVSVTVRSPALQGTRTAVTDNAGSFRFPGVPPGIYTLTARLPGLATVERPGVRVALSETKTVSLTMGLAKTEEVVVTGQVPAVDTASTTGGTSYEAGIIRKLPIGTYYTDVVQLQPGVQQDNGDVQGRSLALSIYGSTSAENLFLIDGVNTTNVIKGIQGKAINYTFLEEVEVKTGGYQAEYGRNMGGVVNVVTRQGGNEFHGGALGLYGNASLRAEKQRDITPAYSQEGDVQASALNPKNDEFLAGGSLGGYVLKDRIWLFGAYDKYKGDRTTMPLAGVRAGEEFPQTFDADLYSGKLTVRITPSTELNASIFADPETDGGSLVAVPLGTNPASYEGERRIGAQDYSVRLGQVLGRWGYATLQYGRHADRYQTIVADVPRVTDSTARVMYGQLATIYGGWGSVPGTTQNNESTRDAVTGKVSFLLGPHELKVGGDYEEEVTSGESYLSGGQALVIYPCLSRSNYRCDLAKAPVVQTAAGLIPVFYLHQYRTPGGSDTTPVRSVFFSSPSRRWSAFVQDEWRISPSLVVNAGLRYDEQRVYLGNGQVAFVLDNQWSPRFGLSWDFLGDGSSKLYGSLGRYHYALPTDLSVAFFTPYATYGTFNYSATDLAQDPSAPRPMISVVGSYDPVLIDTGLKAPYQDEFALGVEKALDPTLVVGAKFTYRTLGRTIEDRFDLDDSDPATGHHDGAIFNPGGSGPAASGGYKSCNGSGNPTDPTAGECGLPGVPIGDARRVFRGIELTARKRIGESLWAQASYVYSSLRGNYSGAVMTKTGQTDPGANADFDYYQFSDNAYGNLELDRPHSFRLDATYTAPFGLQAGVGLRVRSGVPVSRVGYFNSSYSFSLFLEPRGESGRTPTEWDADAVLGWDLRLGPVTVTPLVYVFNVFDNQVATAYDPRFNPLGFFVTDKNSPSYGQAGVQPGTAAHCPATATAPCTDNSDYMKALGRTNPRVVRVGVKLAF